MIKLLAESAGEAMSKNAIETALRGGDHPQKAIRAAIDKLLKRGWLREQKGAKGAKLHSIAYPCSECGLPVTSQRQRHESCPSGPEGLFE